MKKLQKSATDSIFLGIAGGLGEYFDIDSTLIRFIFVVATILGGPGLLLYIILAIIMPQSNNRSNRNHTSVPAEKDDNWSDF